MSELFDFIKDYGGYAGAASVLGLAVLSLLYFAQAREVKRLREWAGRAPERAAELEQRVTTDATRRAQTGVLPQRTPPPRPGQPQTPAAQAAGAKPGTANGQPSVPAPAPAPAAAGAAAATGAATAGAAAPAASAATTAPPGAAPATGAEKGAAAPSTGDAEKGTAAATPGGPAKTADAEKAPGDAAKTDGDTDKTTVSPPPAAGAGATGAPPAPAGATAAGAVAGGTAGAGLARAAGTTPPPAAPAPGAPGAPAPRTVAGRPRTAAPRPAATPLRAMSSSTAYPQSTGDEHRGRLPFYIGGAAAAVVAIALIAIFALGGGDDSKTPTATQPNVVAPPANSDTTNDAAVSRKDITVAVLNGTTITGLARNTAQKLQRSGFNVPDNLIQTADVQNRSATVVNYVEGQRAAAKAVAEVIGVGSDAIGPIDVNASTLAGSSAQVVVTVGADQQQQG